MWSGAAVCGLVANNVVPVADIVVLGHQIVAVNVVQRRGLFAGRADYDCGPLQVVSEEDVKQGFDIGFVLSLGSEKSGSPVTAEVKGDATQTIEFTRQIPEITAFGGGESLFFWQFKGRGDMPLAAGTRTAAAIIQVPKGTKQLNASIAWDVDLERSRFEEWFKVPTKIDTLPVELPLL